MTSLATLVLATLVKEHLTRHTRLCVRFRQSLQRISIMMCRPHSVLAEPGQRPALGSSPGRTARVQCVQPMLG